MMENRTYLLPYRDNLIVLYGNGDGTLQAQQTEDLPSSSFSPSAALGDFNHDGATDVAYNR